MKFLLALFVFASSVSAQAQGIQFQAEQWSEALIRAKAQNRIIFLDLSSPSYGYYKEITASYTSPGVGAFYNANFINVRINAFNGKDKDVAKRYGALLFPTLLFINSEGQVVHGAIGVHDSTELLALGKAALQKEHRLAAAGPSQSLYTAGQSEAELFRQRLEERRLFGVAHDSTDERLALAYLKTQPDWNKPENQQIIGRYAYNPLGELYRYYRAHREVYDAQITPQQVDWKIAIHLAHYLHDGEPFRLPLEQVEYIYSVVYPNDRTGRFSEYQVEHFQRKGPRDSFWNAALLHYDTYYQYYTFANCSQLTTMARLFNERYTDTTVLRSALTWTLYAIQVRSKIEEFYPDYALAAELYAKLGKREQAAEYDRRAVELGKPAPKPALSTAAEEALPVVMDSDPEEAAREQKYRHLPAPERYLRERADYFAQAPGNLDHAQLNSAAWYVYEHIDDVKHVKLALRWALRSVELQENYHNLDTVAALYYKLGNKKKARQYADRALEKAAATGKDPSATKELLKKIKG